MITQELILQQVAAIKNDSAVFMIDTCIWKKKTANVTVKGASYATYDEGTEIPCRLINRSGADEIPVASQYRAIQVASNTATFRFQVPVDDTETMDEGDIIIYNDVTYEIDHVPVNHALMASKNIGAKIKK